jgi:uncharacterized membrane protein
MLSRTSLERAIGGLLLLTVLDTAYLSWRYLALHGHRVVPGSGLCTWTAHIDCDVVLQTPQANAFIVPNALLGFGFYGGCALWWFAGRRLFPNHTRHLLTTLAFWLTAAAGFTLYFFSLLVRLPALCPFCPWNHLLSWLALACVWMLRKQTAEDPESARTRTLWPLVSVCVGQFILWLSLWALLKA